MSAIAFDKLTATFRPETRIHGGEVSPAGPCA